jgi:hypothetical protein
MNNMKEPPRLTRESYQKIAVYWFSLAANQQLWQELLGSRFAFWTERLGIPQQIVSQCFDSIRGIQSCFENARNALRYDYCPSPPCDLDLTDEQRGLILELLESFAARGRNPRGRRG